MIIERLDLIAFGRFTDQVLDLSAGPTRFHLIYGPNESGKSTSLRAIHALLFGIPHTSDDDFIHPYAAMRVGGRLVNSVSGKAYECVRRKGKQKTLLSPDEQPLDPNLIAGMLRNVDAETFLKRFGLTHEELVAGGQAILEGEGELGEVLFAAGTGTGKLRAIQQQLEKDRRALFVPGGSSGSLNKLIAEYQEQEKQLRQLRLLPITYESQLQELTRETAEGETLRQKRRDETLKWQRLQAYEKASGFLPAREAVLAQLKSLGDNIPLLDDDFAQRRRGLETDWIAARQRLTSQREQRSELTQRHESLRVDERWLAATATIRALMNELGEIEAAERTIVEDSRALEQLERQIDELNVGLARPPRPGELFVTDASLDQPDPALINEAVRGAIDKLVTDYGRLVEKLESARQLEATLQETVTRRDGLLAALSETPDPAPLAEALAAIGKPLSLIEPCESAEAEAARLGQRVLDAVTKLRGFRGDVEQVRRLLPPPLAEIEQLAKQLDQADTVLRQAEALRVAEESRHEEAQTNYREQGGDDELPTRDQLDVARERRDATLAHVQGLATLGQIIPVERIETLAKQLRGVDQISDTMLAAHDRVVRRARLAEELKRAGERVEAAIRKQEEAGGQREQVRQRWAALWDQAGVTAGDPATMRQWLADHAAIRELIEQWDAKRDAADAARRRVERGQEQLLAAIRCVAALHTTADPTTDAMAAPNELAEPLPCSLVDLHALASVRRDALQREQQQREQLRTARDQAFAEWERSRSEFKARQAEWERWQARWADVTGSLSGHESARPETVHGLIRQVDEVRSLRRQRDQTREQIARASARRDEYWARVTQIAKRLELIDGEQPAMASAREGGDCVRELSRLADEQNDRQTQRDRFGRELEALNAKIRQAENEDESLRANLERICVEAGCESIDDLPAIEQASARRREAEKELRGIDQSLRALAGAEPLQDFIDAASAQPADTLVIEIETAAAARDRWEQKWQDQMQLVGKLQSEAARMDGSGEAARVQQEQHNRLSGMRRQAEKYAELTIAQESLKLAIEHYRQQNEGPILGKASRFFSRMTGGEYEALRVDFDEKDQPRLMGVRPGRGGTVAANRMSDGTADALYLSLRLASLEVHLDECEPVPLIVDDCLVQFDDDRATAALEILSDMANRTQVILFTHHRHLLELAENSLPPDSYHTHRLVK